ncbi:unnamed protein product, partial [Nesidiocoris tenuis]
FHIRTPGYALRALRPLRTAPNMASNDSSLKSLFHYAWPSGPGPMPGTGTC